MRIINSVLPLLRAREKQRKLPTWAYPGTTDAAAGAVDLYLTSDRMADCRGTLSWTVTDLSGGQFTGGALGVDVPANRSRSRPVRPRRWAWRHFARPCGCGAFTTRMHIEELIP
jgi:hypothetical protein